MTRSSRLPGSKTLSFQALIKTYAHRSEIALDKALVRNSVGIGPVEGHAYKEAIRQIS